MEPSSQKHPESMINSVGATVRSCLECRRRKIKCDRCLPCSYCVKVKIQCSYPPSVAGQKGDERPTEEDVIARITTIEQTLKSLEGSLSQIRQLLQTQTSSSAGASYGCEVYQHQQSHGGGKHDTSHRYSLSKALPDPALESLRPPPVLIISLWQKYLENVDPTLKILHAPTAQKQIMGIIRGQRVLFLPVECLMFAIYYAAAVTLTVEDCRVEFNENKSDMVKRYRIGVENCLEKAQLQESSDMTILQAFIIYLSCCRHDDQASDMRKLIGIAIGIAFKLGLHRDGSELGLPPFQIEMRRRIWWQIYIIDTYTAEEYGTNPRILKSWFDTKSPLNVNDASLDPDMQESPQTTYEKTEMLFVLMRIKACIFARRTIFSDQFFSENNDSTLSASHKCTAIDLFREETENQLCGCDQNIALVYFTTSYNRLALAKLKLTASKPRVRQDQSFLIHVGFRKICTEILHQAATLRRYEKGRQWLWTFQTSLEWEALTYLLINLSLAPKGEGLDLAWKAVDEIYNCWRIDDISRGHHWDNVDDLRSKALRARDMIRNNPAQWISPNEGNLGDPKPITQPFSAPKRQGEVNFCSDEERTPKRRSEQSQPGPQEQLSRMWALANIAVAAPTAVDSLSRTVGSSQPTDTPSSGTGCQWSATLFERYFQILDSEHMSPL